VVAKVAERLALIDKIHRSFDVERFNIRKLMTWRL
jgi:hypothetical protein